MNTDEKSSTSSIWIAAATGAGRVRHLQRSRYPGYAMCGTQSKRWRPAHEDELEECRACIRRADKEVMLDLEIELEQARRRLLYAADLRRFARLAQHGALTGSLGRKAPTRFASKEMEEEFLDASNEVRLWLLNAADALDPNGARP